mmetsp:Transcript_10275/g.27965  ORF Transcript_10275/g.27965 Transcript_10275/m.27965 type:complete len:117 (+) Transcript_10275:908-1258(+)
MVVDNIKIAVKRSSGAEGRSCSKALHVLHWAMSSGCTPVEGGSCARWQAQARRSSFRGGIGRAQHHKAHRHSSCRERLSLQATTFCRHARRVALSCLDDAGAMAVWVDMCASALGL